MFAWQLECEKLTVQCDRHPLFNLCGQRVKDMWTARVCFSEISNFSKTSQERNCVYIGGMEGWCRTDGLKLWAPSCLRRVRSGRRRRACVGGGVLWREEEWKTCVWMRKRRGEGLTWKEQKSLNISGQPSEESWGRLHRMEILEQGCQSEMSCGLLSSHWTATLVFK